MWQQYQGFIQTPELWENNLFELNQFKLPQINKPDLSQLEDINPRLVLGKRAEHFFSLAIQNSKDYELLANNLQIIYNKETLGEFDFFLRNINRKQNLHVELVYKFYVYDPNFEAEMDRWIGPNRKDSLTRKIKHLKTHQLPLLYQPETTEILENVAIDVQNLEQEVCFKANLFLPKYMQSKNIAPLNSACIVGYYLKKEEFTKKDYGNFEYFSPKKPDWPILSESQQEWFSFTEINRQLEQLFANKKSALLWIKKSATTFERCMVVWW
ncbi:DUF1853 family protein [Haloflavibacter putidus]|uniref:DUF1853 family protein n=1 Tax=Haloflavibacter putidus TaxID=2576776 RepID=UPI001F238725|nr:DUF1853 family protein [Haloflavibacter putidus]